MNNIGVFKDEFTKKKRHKGSTSSTSQQKVSEIIDYGRIRGKILLYKSFIIKEFFSEIEKYIFKLKKIDELEKLTQISELRDIFNFCFEKYKHHHRNNGEPVFIHLIKTSLYTVRNFVNPSIKKIKVAILHDIIEDGIATFNEIREKFGDDIAICILVLSKNEVFKFLSPEEIKNLISKGIIDEKGKLKKVISKKTESQVEAKILYEEKKEERNEVYYSRFKSKENIIKFVKKITNEQNINIENWDLDEIMQIIIDVKFGDRCHNLCTQWDPYGIKQIFKKIKETKKYLLPIAKKFNIHAYHLMKFFIDELYSINIKTIDGKKIGNLKNINWTKLNVIDIKTKENNILGDNVF